MIAGRIVQINSIICPSSKNRLINLLANKLSIMYPTKIVIINKIIKVWSWKKTICSIKGEALFCKLRLDHVAISKKRIILYKWGLNPLHMICHIRSFLK